MVARRFILAEFMDSSSAFVRQVVASRSVVTLRFNATSTAYLTVAETHPIVPLMVAEEGARCAVWLVTIDGGSASRFKLLEGRVGSLAGDDAPRGTVTIPVLADFADFATLLGWQVPGAGIAGQGAAEFWTRSGPSESNALAAIAANAARLGRPWDVAVSGGRGTVAPLELRMTDLASGILDPLTADRLQLVIDRDRSTGRWAVGVVEGEVFSRPITPQSGILQSWSWVKQPATATRVVVGGAGSGVAREFALVVDAALEAEMGVALEVFVDAAKAEAGADLVPYGRAELAKRRPSAGLTASLRDASWFRFPEVYRVGTRVSIRIGALEVDDVVSQIEITHDAGSGLRIEPTVGVALRDPQARLVGFVNNVATAVRGLERR